MPRASTSGSQPAPLPRRRWLAVGLVLSGVFAALSVAAIATLFLAIALFSVPSSSNEPTLRVGDNFLAVCHDLDCRFGMLPFLPRLPLLQPALGDIAVFRKPNDPSIIFVKRIVGMPGDEVQMRSGLLFINRAAVPETPLAGYALEVSTGATGTVPQFEETLPNGVRYRMIRRFPENALADTEAFKVPPDHYFVIGDNRDNSSDSRDPEGGIGFVPRRNMLARAYWVTFSTTRLGRFLVPVDLPRAPGR